MNRRFLTAILATGLILMLASAGFADVIPTPNWKSFLGMAYYNGQPAPAGSIIDAYDMDGIHCGTFVVRYFDDTAGIYGSMPVYGDDPYSDLVDEGAESGEMISFEVNGRPASTSAVDGDVFWAAQEIAEIDLEATGTACASAASYVEEKLGYPDSTIRFYIPMENCGNGIDFYGVEALSSRGWGVNVPSEFIYALPGGLGNVWFEIKIPAWPGANRVDTVHFTVFSHLDPTVQVTGMVVLTADITATYVMTLTDPADEMAGEPEFLVPFEVGVRNDGNQPDEYFVTAISSRGWSVDIPAPLTYVTPGGVAYLTFSVWVPIDAVPGDLDVITYKVHSASMPPHFVGSSVNLNVLATDVDDGDNVLMPDGYSLAQNYPNPFNPVTNIAFNLPSKSSVSLEIIDILGRYVDVIDLGTLSAGSHEYMYDAEGLSSGVYFYRLQSDMGAQTRKMVLLK